MSYDIDGFSTFALNPAAASIAFGNILWQLLCVPLSLSPLPLWVLISSLSKHLYLLLRIVYVILPSWGSFSFSYIARYVFLLLLLLLFSFPFLDLQVVWGLFGEDSAFLVIRSLFFTFVNHVCLFWVQPLCWPAYRRQAS